MKRGARVTRLAVIMPLVTCSAFVTSCVSDWGMGGSRSHSPSIFERATAKEREEKKREALKLYDVQATPAALREPEARVRLLIPLCRAAELEAERYEGCVSSSTRSRVEQLATAGLAEAQFQLGHLDYLQDRGLVDFPREHTLESARRWMALATNQGHPNAPRFLAWIEEEQKLNEALRKARALKHLSNTHDEETAQLVDGGIAATVNPGLQALCNELVAHEEHLCREAEPQKVAHCDLWSLFPSFLRLAQNGVADAQFWVGVFYDEKNMGKSFEHAARAWYGRAAAQGQPDAIRALAKLDAPRSTKPE